MVLADESLVRGDRRIARGVNGPRFETCAAWKTSTSRSISRSIERRCLNWQRSLPARRSRRVNVWATGTGKSHLAQAIGHAVIRSGALVYYRSIFDVVRDFLHDEATGGEEKVLARYLKPDLLIIDDMGMKQLPKRSGEYLFEIIMRRHEVRSTMMTTNRPLEDWGKLIGDVPAASAILDRFLQTAEIMKITGRSYRLGKNEKSPKGAQSAHRLEVRKEVIAA